MATLYENIRKRRKELGLTQGELALMVGYADKDMISKIEKGKVDIKESRIRAFAKALEMPASELFGEGAYSHEPRPLFVGEQNEEGHEINMLLKEASKRQRKIFLRILKAVLDK